MRLYCHLLGLGLPYGSSFWWYCLSWLLAFWYWCDMYSWWCSSSTCWTHSTPSPRCSPLMLSDRIVFLMKKKFWEIWENVDPFLIWIAPYYNLIMKETIRENVMDSRSLEVKMLVIVSAVVSPVGLFLKHMKWVWKVRGNAVTTWCCLWCICEWCDETKEEKVPKSEQLIEFYWEWFKTVFYGWGIIECSIREMFYVAHPKKKWRGSSDSFIFIDNHFSVIIPLALFWLRQELKKC